MTGSLWGSHVRVTAAIRSSSEKLKMENSSGESDPVEVQKYQLDGVKGAVHTTQKVTIPPFQTINIKGNAGVKGHCMKVQILKEWTKWAHEKVEAFQAKEAKRHKQNYDKKVRAAALEVGDTVLVHVTTFKGQHKM